MIAIFSVGNMYSDNMLKCMKIYIYKMYNKLNGKFSNNIIIYVYKIQTSSPLEAHITYKTSREMGCKGLILHVSLLRITHFEHLKLMLFYFKLIIRIKYKQK